MSAGILIVDDARFMRSLLREILEGEGYRIVGEATNGREAVDSFEQLRPDLVTMDIQMPEMDGIQALKAICERHPDARIIMCSALGQEALVVESIESGARDFIIKPFSRDRVLMVVGDVLAGPGPGEPSATRGSDVPIAP